MGWLPGGGLVPFRHCFHPFLQYSGRFRQVVLLNLPALRAESKTVVLNLEEGDSAGLLRQRFIENQDRGLDAGIRLEHSRRQRNHGDKVFFHQHLA